MPLLKDEITKKKCMSTPNKMTVHPGYIIKNQRRVMTKISFIKRGKCYLRVSSLAFITNQRHLTRDLNFSPVEGKSEEREREVKL